MLMCSRFLVPVAAFFVLAAGCARHQGGAGLPAAGEAESTTAAAPRAPAPARDEVIKHWDFRGGDLHGWEAENDLSPLEPVDGAVRTRVTGVDGFMAVRDLGITADSVSHVVIRMRSTGAGACQVYYATDQFPNPAENEIRTFAASGDNAMRDYVVDMGGIEQWSGLLTYFRVDLINGIGAGPVVEVESIRLERRAPRLRPFSFAPTGAWLLPGRPVGAVAEVHSTAPDDTRIEFLRPGLSSGEVVTVLEAEQRMVAATEWPGGVFAGFSPVVTVEARAANSTGSTVSMRTPVLVADPSSLEAPSGSPRVALVDGGAVVEGRGLSLAVVRGPDGYAGGVLRVRDGVAGRWRIAGVLAPLAVASWQPADTFASRWEGIQFQTARVVHHSLILEAQLPGGAGEVELALSIDDRAGEMVVFETRLVPRIGGDLHRFSGPVLLAGEGAFGARKDDGLLPGVEFLGADEPSSQTDAVGESLGYRPRPVPTEVTVPLMAVSYNGLGVGMMWDALQRWDAGTTMPRPEFASPNFLDGGDNHRMALFVPGGRPWSERNAAVPEMPYAMQPGHPLVLRGRIFASPGEDSYTAVPLWYRVYGQPQPVEAAVARSETLDILAQGWATTCYDPAVDGFVNHWRWHDTHSPMPHVEARLVSHAHETGDWRWAERVGQPRGRQVYDILGPVVREVGATHRPGLLDTQRPDGSWGYTLTEEVRERCLEFTDGERDRLGEEGATNAGITGFAAIHLIPYAQRTGDPEAIDGLLRAIDAASRFSVPRGSQVWEVHMDIPDIFASANLVDMCVAAFEFTGDPAYLDLARAWAYTGLPFLYSWQVPGVGPGAVCVVIDDAKTPEVDPFTGFHPAGDVFHDPDRQVTPYASIPVFGTSFWTVSWFGNIVQWCGVRWAMAVHRLDEYRPDPVLRTAAEGVVESARQQTFDKEPVLGLFPDSWNTATNHTGFIMIGPGPVEDVVRQFEGIPDGANLHARPLHGSGGAVRVVTRGRITGHVDRTPAGGVTWNHVAFTSQATESAVFGVDEPQTVTADGHPIPRAVAPGDLGWMYDADMRAVSIHRIAQSEREVFVVE